MMSKQQIKLKNVWATLMALCLFLSAIAHPVSINAEGSGAARQGGAANGMVRVLLSSLGDITQVDLTVAGSYSLDGSGATALVKGSSVTVRLDTGNGHVLLSRGGTTVDMGTELRLWRHESSGDNGIKIAQSRQSGNLYPGDVQFKSVISGGSYRLQTIVHVFIEDYLYGVLPYEMGNSAPLEALKAQSVSARTYTVRAMQNGVARDYDLVDTTNDQVYNGTPVGNDRCRQAVDATRGIVSMNGSSFTATYYTASNGGQIESVRNIWGSAGYDYIKVKDDPYDYQNTASTVKSFTVVATGAQSNAVLSGLLVEKARQVFGGESVVIRSVNALTPHTPRFSAPSRLYTKLDFHVSVLCDGVNKAGTLTFDIFSELESPLNMGINYDNNELWSVTKTNTGFVVEARRFGHGTGMSQRGAMRMAQMGYRYDQILAFYFEGCARVQYTFVRSEMSALGSGSSTTALTPVPPADLSSEAGCTAVVAMPSVTAEMALRTAASGTADIIIGIPHGAAVKVYEQAGSWYRIGYGDLVGYAHGDGLKISGMPSGTGPAVTVLSDYGKVKSSSYLNLRSTANTVGEVLAQIPAGTILPLLSVKNGWGQTQYACQSGYVSMDYILRSDRYTGSATDADAAGAQVIPAGGTPLYLSPSTAGYCVMTVPQGASVKVKYDDGSWSCVYYAGVTGYVLSAVLQKNGTIVEEEPDLPGNGEQYALVASKAASLNLRESAGMSATVMMEIPRGETLIVMQQGADWCKVRYHGVSGYCSTQYLSIGVSGDDVVEGTLTAVVTTASGSLNLRKSESKQATILTTIPRGTSIPVLERGGVWSKVSYGGFIGFVMNEFLTFASSGSIPEIPELPSAPLTPSTPGSVPASARVTTASGSLNLRKRPQSGAGILDRIPQHATVPVLAVEGTWTKVMYHGTTGYVMSAFLTYLSGEEAPSVPVPPVTPPDAGTAVYAQVATRSGSLNLRRKAQSSAAILDRIPQNTIIPVLEKLGTWTKVEYSGTTGYVMTTFLLFVDVEAPKIPQPTENVTGKVLSARVTTEKGSLNLRAQASSNAGVLTTIPQYAVIPVLTRGGRWTQVTYREHTGYVMTSFLTFIESSDPPTGPSAEDAKEEYARVTTSSGSLNLRKKDSTSASVIATIPQNDLVVLLEKGAVWSRVEHEGKTGYVKNEFLTFIRSVPATQPEQPQNNPPEALIELPISRSVRVLTSAGSVKLRAQPDENSTALAVILSSEYVLLEAQGSEWCRISYEGIEGYLMTEVLETE